MKSKVCVLILFLALLEGCGLGPKIALMPYAERAKLDSISTHFTNLSKLFYLDSIDYVFYKNSDGEFVWQNYVSDLGREGVNNQYKPLNPAFLVSHVRHLWPANTHASDTISVRLKKVYIKSFHVGDRQERGCWMELSVISDGVEKHGIGAVKLRGAKLVETMAAGRKMILELDSSAYDVLDWAFMSAVEDALSH